MTGPRDYLQGLTLKLLEGVEKLPEATRRRHLIYLLASQNRDGGFSGREGGSDLYYTGFALRGLAVLQGLSPELGERAGGFLRDKLAESASVIDLFSLLVGVVLTRVAGGPDVFADAPADWPDRVGHTLETFRTPDGGYAKSAGEDAGSTYHSFLIALTYELLGRELPESDRLVAFVSGRRREDGGFVEVAAMRKSGTNPTAAGVGVLQICGALTDDVKQATADFLAGLPSELEGGYRANTRIPGADLLSTFTASWTLYQLGAAGRIDVDAVRSYALAVEEPSGGFRGGLWDKGFDVEYTFYGLGTLALMAEVGQ